jgi:hypothetical protein
MKLTKKYEDEKIALQKTIDEKNKENIQLMSYLEDAGVETLQLLELYAELTSTIRKNLTYEDKKQLSHKAQDKKDVTLIKEYLAFLIKNKDIISQNKDELEQKLKQAEHDIKITKDEKLQLNQKYIDLEAAIVDQYPDFKSQVPAVGKIQLALTASSSKVILTAREQQLQDILSDMKDLQKLLYPDEGNQKNEQLIQDQVDNMLGYIQKVIERQNNPPVTGGRQYNQMFYKPTITNQIFDSSYMACNFEFMFIITLLIVLSVYLLYLVYQHGRSKRIYQSHQGSQSQQSRQKPGHQIHQRCQTQPDRQQKNSLIIQHPYVSN